MISGGHSRSRFFTYFGGGRPGLERLWSSCGHAVGRFEFHHFFIDYQDGRSLSTYFVCSFFLSFVRSFFLSLFLLFVLSFSCYLFISYYVVVFYVYVFVIS